MLEKKIKVTSESLPNEIKEYLLEEVYMIKLEKVIEERCDELDYLLEDYGHEIIHQVYKRVATSIYNYTVYFL